MSPIPLPIQLARLKAWLQQAKPACYPLDPNLYPLVKQLFFDVDLATKEGYPKLEVSACETYLRIYDEKKGEWPRSPFAAEKEKAYYQREGKMNTYPPPSLKEEIIEIKGGDQKRAFKKTSPPIQPSLF